MNTSPITSWEGAEAYFTFGPNSFGVWFAVIAAVALFIGFIVYTVRHERHRFAESVTNYPELQAKVEAARYAGWKEKPEAIYLPALSSAIPSMPQPE